MPVTHPLDERGIALRSHDVLIDATRVAGIHRLPRYQLAVDRQFQILKRRAAGQRKQVVGLADHSAAIHESLFDLIPKHTIRELDADVASRPNDARPTVPNRHRHRPVIDRHDADSTRPGAFQTWGSGWA